MPHPDGEGHTLSSGDPGEDSEGAADHHRSSDLRAVLGAQQLDRGALAEQTAEQKDHRLR